ncbi:MAG: hypothetical protein RL017_770 [Pseudomonadota bacterium]|jgi:uncharacterized protein YcfL|nr:YcfL family protein [Burkholderiales bacterium]
MLKKVIVISSLLLSLYGCGTTTPTIKSKTEVIGNVSNIEVTDLRTKRVNGVFQAQATIVNTSGDTPQDIYYRCHFYDADKFDISGDVPWNPMQIYGGQSRTIECMSEANNVSDFRVELSSTGASVKVYK